MNILESWQRKNWFGELVYQGDQRKTDSSDILRLYVLVRDDILPPLHQGIQAAHACVLLASKMPVDPNSYLILLGASEEQMLGFMRKLDKGVYKKIAKPVHAAYFDQGLVDPEAGFPVMTALAFEPMSLKEGNRLFGHLKRSE